MKRAGAAQTGLARRPGPRTLLSETGEVLGEERAEKRFWSRWLTVACAVVALFDADRALGLRLGPVGICFECEAWVETVLADPSGPDVEAYLARRLDAMV